MLQLVAAALLGAALPPPVDDDDHPARTERQAPPTAREPREREDEEEEEGGRVDAHSPIVVTARRLDAARTRIDESLGATVYALDNDVIENRPGGETGSIAAILTQTPGVTRDGDRLSIRGARANQVRINDVIVPEAIADPADQLSSRLAETTRVITGTLPAQFGFAPAGVISVTTKSGAYQHGGQLEFFAGSDGMIEPAAEWAGTIADASLFASGSFERERSRIADAAGRSARDLRHGIEGLAFADHLLGANDRLSLILGGSRQRQSIGATTIGAGTERSDEGYAVETFQHSLGGFTLQASLFAGRAAEEAEFAQRSRERRTAWGTQIDGAYQAGAAHLLRAGLLITRSLARELDVAGRQTAARRTPVGLYAQDEWKLAPALTFNPGVRIEWLRGLGARPEIEPRASFAWRSATGLSAHLGYARYAAAPPLGVQGPGPTLPNERDDYLDAGLQQRTGAFTFGIDLYRRFARNFLAERSTPGQATPAAFAFERADFRGLELSATYAQGPVTAWANLAVSRARGRTILGGAGLFAPAVLVAAADRWLPLASERPLSGSGGFTWRTGALSLSGDVLASSGTVRTVRADDPNGSRASPFALFGAALVYHLRIAERPADLRLDLTNIGDVRYATSDAANLEGGWTRWARGRAITIGIEQGF